MGKKIWGTYYGGDGGNQAANITKDIQGNLYFSGMASSTSYGYSTPGVHMEHPSGPYENEVYVAKFKDCTANISVSPNLLVCPGNEIRLTASGGTSYEWSGPNGFASTAQNPVITNATAAMSGSYSVKIYGAGECDGTLSVDVKVDGNTAPVPDITNLPTLKGDCTFQLPQAPMATDACGAKITATLVFIPDFSKPGNYILEWQYKDLAGRITVQKQNVTIEGVALPTTTSYVQAFCKTSSPKVSNIAISGTTLKYYNEKYQLLDPNSTLAAGYYFISQTLNGCESEKVKVEIKLTEIEKPKETATQEFCSASNATLKNLHINGTQLKFYNSAGQILPETTLLQNSETYFVSQSVNGCESDKIMVTALVSNGNLTANNYSESICNDTFSDSKTINLNNYREKLAPAATGYNFEWNGSPLPENYTLKSGQNLFKIKISNVDGCYREVELSLTLNPKPQAALPATAEFCEGKPVMLDAGSGAASYLWSTGEKTQSILVQKEGVYSVVVSSTGCENTASTTVRKSVLGEILKVQIVNQTATIQMSTTGDFLYSLDGVKWASSNVFEKLSSGSYKVFVKTGGGCILGEKTFSIFSIPDAFTPNGDGINDYWIISGLENYPGSIITVLDRLGKIVFQRTTDTAPVRWDGKIAGRPIAGGSYWYTIKVSDGRIHNGWILLKNRE